MVVQIDIKKIIYERANQGLNLRELSKKSGIMVTTIQRMERGEKVRLDTIGKIAKALGKGVEDFVIDE